MSDGALRQVLKVSDAIVLFCALFGGAGFWLVSTGGPYRVLVGIAIDLVAFGAFLRTWAGFGEPRDDRMRRLKGLFQ